MSKSKRDMQSRVQKAAQALDERFKRAQAVVERQPTGFSVPVDPDPATPPEPDRRGKAARFASVPIDQVDPNPYNARRIYRPERVKELAGSIAAAGQLIPAIATQRGGRYTLIAGHYRWKAIKLAGLERIDLMLHDGLSDQELYQYSFRENNDRNQQSALDNALAWRDLLERRVYAGETELAEATGMSLPQVNKTLRILGLSAAVIERVSQNPEDYAMSALYELALLEASAGPEVALQMAERLGRGEAGRRDVQELRALHEHPKDRKRKENSRQYKIRAGEAHIGTIKEWDSGRVALDVVVADATERTALVEELKRRFGVDAVE